jgi:DNA polymerase-3 subunit epsilon
MQSPAIVIGIDLETANPRGAICEFAAVALDVRTGTTIFSCVTLVDPGPVEWHFMNSAIHGIRSAHVRGKPSIRATWKSFEAELSRRTDHALFAHNASFERRMLAGAIPSSNATEIQCTMRLAKATLALSNYRLPTVCAALKIPFRETHRAEPDARAAAEVARRLILGHGRAGVRSR